MIGQTINQYKIVEHLGAGGMGEVYLAVDSKLDRKVALKFLPPAMSAQPDAKARFLQEARAASALNHPNICTIHDIQEHDGQLFIVMEYVDGQTLRQKRATLSLKQILEVGAQIADGLAAAHEQGIVHRDIKSENIMIRKDGIVQIMDFGLAKLHGTTRLTKEGSTIGTVGYMSPEQVQGLDLDHRSDIFSLGVVLYELLTDQLPFKGMHDTAIMYEIVNVDAAPPSALRPEIEPELDRIILECLDKDRDERYQSAKELGKDLRRHRRESDRSRVSRVSTIRPLPATTGTKTTAPPRIEAQPKRLASLIPWGITAAFAVAVLGFSWVLFTRHPAPTSAIRFSVPSPTGMSLNAEGSGTLAFSPDGTRLAFVAQDTVGAYSLWVRPVNSFTSERLAGTEDAHYPFWSPDSRQVAFFAEGKLKKIDVTGGPPLTLCDAPQGRGGSWNRDGIIVFAPRLGSALSRVPAAGGVPSPVTVLDTVEHQTSHRWPWFLPDGNQFLYFARIGPGSGTAADDSIWVGSLNGKVSRPLMMSGANAYYANGYLFYLRDRTLMAQPFNANSAALSGEPVPMAEDVYFDAGYQSMALGLSENGGLAYQTGAFSSGSRLIWYDRTGKPVDTLGERGAYFNCALSPDGRSLAVDLIDPLSNQSDVWIYDLSRRIRTRLTFTNSPDQFPVWTADGRTVLYASARETVTNLFRKPATGAGTEDSLLITSQNKSPMDCSLDGKFLVYLEDGSKGIGDDLWILPLAADGSAAGAPYGFQQTEFDEDDARFSPDGRWLAYASTESGQSEVYVRPFPGPGGKWQISPHGGDFPSWRRDGKELYYISSDNQMTAVDVDGRGNSFVAGQAKPLFAVHPPVTNKPYDVTADGQRFVVVTSDQGVASSSISVVVHWDAERKEK
jgi:serine/threonine protein kinase